MRGHDTDIYGLTSRRSFLLAAGVATTGAVPIGGELLSGTDSRDDHTSVFRTGSRTSPLAIQSNPRVESNRSPPVEALLFEPVAEYDVAADTFVPVLADDWSFEAESMTITLQEGYNWHDGTPIDGGDLERQLLIDRQLDAEYWELVAGVRSEGQTVTVEFSGPVNESVVRFELLRRRLDAPPGQFSAGDPGVDEPVPLSEAVGSGPFAVADVEEGAATLSLHDGYPGGDEIGIESVVFESRSSASEQWAGLADAELSGSGSAYFPDQFRTYEGATPVESLVELTAPSDAGWGVIINHRHPLLSDRRVRQAVAHLFSSADAVKAIQDTIPEVIELQTGVAPHRTAEYLEGELGRFERYGSEKRAAELLGEAGFARIWEQWMDPRGEHVELGFVVGGNPHADDGQCLGPAVPGWFYGAREFVTQLRTFLGTQEGPAATVSEADAVQSFDGVGPHDDVFAFLPARQWGHFDGSHPYHSYRSDLLMREASALGYGPEVTVPPYADPSGAPETVDLRTLLDELRRVPEGSEAERDLVRELAWVVNQTVPYLQGYYRPSAAYVGEGWTTDETGITPQTAHLTRTGGLQPIDQ